MDLVNRIPWLQQKMMDIDSIHNYTSKAYELDIEIPDGKKQKLVRFRFVRTGIIGDFVWHWSFWLLTFSSKIELDVW